MENNKKGQLKGYLIAIILMVMVITAFIVIPNKSDISNGNVGFFSAHGTTFTMQEDLNEINNTQKNISQTMIDISCDINPDSDSCQGASKSSSASNDKLGFINWMVGNGYGAIITIQKSLGLGERMISTTSKILKIPSEIYVPLITLLIITILISIVFIIFNRSDG